MFRVLLFSTESHLQMVLGVEFLTRMLQDKLHSMSSHRDLLPDLICPSFPTGEVSHKHALQHSAGCFEA